MRQFLKNWGGWLTFAVYAVISIAVYFATLKSQKEDIEDIKQTQHEIRDFMDEQLTLNGQIIQYMIMDSE